MFKKSLLKNGMTLVSERLPQFESLSVGVWVKAGTRHETPSEGGLSHFLEHMMFKGTASRSALDIAHAIDRVGGEFNAFTAREYTCFHILLLAKDINLAIDILADILLNSKFDELELEKERKVIQQEISMIDDSPEEVLHDEFFSQSFGGHALGKPILGTEKSVSSFSRDEVYSYFRRHYSAQQMIVSVAGNVDHELVRKKLDSALALGLSSSANRRLPNMSKPRLVPSEKVIRKKIEQSHILVGFPGLSLINPDRFILSLLNVHLGGGMSSLLFQEIREKRGLAYSVYSSQMSFSDMGLFTVYLGTSAVEVPECLGVIGDELKKLKESPIDRQTLTMLKENLKSTLRLNGDSTENRMSYLARSEMYFEKCLSLKELCKLLDQVTANDIQRMARKVFNPEKMVLTVLGPSTSKRKYGKLLSGRL